MAELKVTTTPEIDALVKATVEASLATALLKNTEGMVKEIVKGALAEAVTRPGYPRESILKESIRYVIREEAVKQMRAWVEANQEKIRSAVVAALNPYLDRLAPTTAVCIKEAMAHVRMNITPFANEDAKAE